MEEELSRFERIKRSLATFSLITWMFPYRCGGCGRPLQKIYLKDLPPEEQRKHKLADTAWMVDQFMYWCSVCFPDMQAVSLVA